MLSGDGRSAATDGSPGLKPVLILRLYAGVETPPPSVSSWIRFGFREFRSVPTGRGWRFGGRLSQGDALGYFRFLPTGDWEAVPPAMGRLRAKIGASGFIVPRSQRRDLGHPFI